MSSPSHSSVLIVGAGIFGSSTAYHLSKTHPDPSSITVVDRTPSPPSPAASTDINKIIRADYTSRFYMDLAYEAIEAWNTWPELKEHYHRTGWIMLDEEGSDVAEGIRENFRERGEDPTSDVNLKELGEMWNGILSSTDTRGYKSAYWNPLAGWCDAADATASLMKAAMGRGVKYECGDVERLVLLRNGKGVKGVTMKNGKTYTADQIVLATGAWTSQILSATEDELDIADADRVEQQVKAFGVCVAHFKMNETELRELEEMPVVVYGVIGEALPPPRQNSLLKYTNANTFTNTITTSSGHQISVPPDRDQRIVSEKLKKETQDLIISKVMPQYSRDRTPEYWRLCWDAATPTQDQLITRHPHERLGNLILAVGGSGHSYKFLPVIGQYVTNVVNGVSSGEEKDAAWAWKTGKEKSGRGAHEKVFPKRELRDLEDEEGDVRAKL
ncbi:FAD dependent oxidoreductase [Cryomyces antarcticus]